MSFSAKLNKIFPRRALGFCVRQTTTQAYMGEL